MPYLVSGLVPLAGNIYSNMAAVVIYEFLCIWAWIVWFRLALRPNYNEMMQFRKPLSVISELLS